jgi:hypothetical protein
VRDFDVLTEVVKHSATLRERISGRKRGHIEEMRKSS